MEYQYRENDGGLSLRGGITIDQVSGLRTALLDALSGSDSVTIDLSKADSIDLACIQLLCSAHHTAFTMGKALSLCDKKSEGALRSAIAAGYLRHTGCKFDVSKTCLWVEKFWREQ